MLPRLSDLQVDQLAALPKGKSELYNQMLTDNEEFEKVKKVFVEIKEIGTAMQLEISTDRNHCSK